MNRHPIEADLDRIPDDLTAELERFGFDRDWFMAMVDRYLSEGTSGSRVQADIEPPRPEDVADLPDPGSDEHQRLSRIGGDALTAGECAFVVLAGGMATRMGGVVKALVEVLDGRSFLDLRLAERASLEERFGATVPLWMMTSNATEDAIRAALGDELDGYRTATFPQKLSLRVDPDGGLFFDQSGRPSQHAPGHGDFPEVLSRSGLLDMFRSRGGRYITMCNIDNLGATLDPAIIGLHIESGADVTCEVVDKHDGDKGGGPVRMDGRPVILEEFRLPEGFDPSTVTVFNTNTFHFAADSLAELDMEWTYSIVDKDVDGTPAIQFERIVNEVTHTLVPAYARVPRTGGDSRFIPVKDFEELERRADDIQAVITSRGIES